MHRIKITINIFLILFVLTATGLSAFAQEKEKITLLIGTSNSYKVGQAIRKVVEVPGVADNFNFYFYTDEDLRQGKVDQKVITRSRIIIINDMHNEWRTYVLKNADFRKTKVYGLIRAGMEQEKIISDPRVKQYYAPPTKKNIKNLLLFLLNRDCGLDINYGQPRNMPEIGIFHPKGDKIFTSFKEYLAWYRQKGLYKAEGFWVGIPDFFNYVFPGETGHIVTSLIENLENNNINVLPVYSYPPYFAIERFFFDEQGRSRINLIAALSLKFANIDDKKVKQSLIKLGVPLLNSIRMYFRTIPEWRESSRGLGIMLLSSAVCRPEINGLIEPTVLGGRVVLRDELTNKDVYADRPIKENIEFFVKRIKAWRNLQTKANKDKKIVIMYWNHTPGKQNVGATYLNLFRSLKEILKRMREEGYKVKGEIPSEEEVKELVLKSGRNIGSWVPGELENLINTKRVIRLPVAKYLEWYKEIDEHYKKRLEAEWGEVEDSKIMIKDKEIIIPYVNMGNVVLVPQPSRGWADDPMKLYHSTQLWTHHQYTAFYLWLKREVNADAIISLGTHGTHEWLPGKQVGLSQSCPPEVLIQDLPNIYPYIMDNIGEGLQAKRRGRGVIIDHLIPAMKKAGVYEEYRNLAGLINEYNDALTRSHELAEKKFKRIRDMVKKLGLDKDLLLKELDEEAIEEIEHYLIELQEANVPYGMHTLGVSPQGEALKEFSRIIKERNKGLLLGEIKKRLGHCSLEIDRLIAGLEGKYIPSGEGNDPLRNPEAIPTGKNFYGFDPAKVPSKDAYALGKEQAKEMIRNHLKEKGEYPDKVGLILWSIELQRNEGTQVGTALYLLGMRPVWDDNDRVTGVEPIPGAELGRPRIDVHLQVSGLFRDSYPNIILLLDKAVRQASHLKDVENFVAKHSRKIKHALVQKGHSEEKADDLSTIRVFSARPGSYGNTLEDLIPNSGFWESDEELADVFINFVSFGYGKGIWGEPLKSAYKKNLEDVKITMHTRSSNLFMNMDTDDVFTCLGGLSLAVKRVGGEYPNVVLSIQEDPDKAHIEDIERTLGKELRARYLNPKWIEGMKKEDYAGAREMSRFVEHMWGWQVTTPFAVDETKWMQTYEVYVEDKYGMDLKEFFNRANPWSYQSITARMLEAVRKGYWKADESLKKKLAVEYAVNVVEKGIACCDHTCNNPLMNQMVVNIVSLPGVMSPEMVEQFRIAVEQAMGKALDEKVKDRRKLQKKLQEGFNKKPRSGDQKSSRAEKDSKQVSKGGSESKVVEGLKMEETKAKDDTTDISSSGIQWFAALFILVIIGLAVYGAKRHR